jgi:hypothetical protein
MRKYESGNLLHLNSEISREQLVWPEEELEDSL